MGFTLRNGISFCRVGDRIIFLDIVTDRYFCLSPEAEHSFRALAEDGTPPPGSIERWSSRRGQAAEEGP